MEKSFLNLVVYCRLYGDGASNTVEENANVSSACPNALDAGSKTAPTTVLNWGVGNAGCSV